jgi:general transcription factor 3C polypeptide 4
MTFTIPGQVPIASLRPIFLYLLKSGTLPRVHSRLLEILHPPSSFPSLDVDTSGTPGGTNEVKYAFQRSLKKHLFGCRDLLSLRLRLSVADFCWVCGVHLVRIRRR